VMLLNSWQQPMEHRTEPYSFKLLQAGVGAWAAEARDCKAAAQLAWT
jgi:hypothetical protein